MGVILDPKLNWKLHIDTRPKCVLIKVLISFASLEGQSVKHGTLYPTWTLAQGSTADECRDY